MSTLDEHTYPADDLLDDDEDPPRGWLQRVWRFIRNQSNRVLLLTGVVLFTLAYFWPAIFVTIDSGQVGVMYKRFAGGTVTDRLLGEGLRFVPPWDKLFVYNTRLQEIRHAMSALTEEGLEINFELSIRYRPELELVGLLHQRVGPDYAQKVVVPEVESGLRSIVGGQKLDVIYTSSREVVQRVVTEVLEEASRNYVHIDEVVVRSIVLPQAVRERIEAKMIEKETAEAYEFRLQIATSEAERRRIEAGGIATYNSLVNASLTPNVMQWEALQVTKELAKSPNAKTIIIGRTGDGLPIILPPQ
ncbi:MAG: prohibitin family protein [Acidobacteriota bacterium]|nr:prohibitin family protein [Acidobacteriota bacterium]